MKRVFIIHGWDGFPEEAWLPWLKNKLQEQGLAVTVPAMPDAETPKINQWVPYLAKLIGQPDSETFLVGHSIGVQTILRYLETINVPIGGVVSVCGFYNLIPGSLETKEETEIARPWLETPIDNDQVKKKANKVTAIFSDNDPFVGLENINLFTDRLGAKIVVLKGKGHLGSSDGINEVPEIFNELLELIGR
jgi:predicted alpha/beta hydrolase family esterase